MLSARAESVDDITKIAALHHAGGRFRCLATAFDPIASVDSQSLVRLAVAV